MSKIIDLSNIMEGKYAVALGNGYLFVTPSLHHEYPGLYIGYADRIDDAEQDICLVEQDISDADCVKVYLWENKYLQDATRAVSIGKYHEQKEV